MTDKNTKILLRVILVVVALGLGFSLNVFQFRSLFMGPDTGPVTSQKGNEHPEPRMEQPADKQAPAASAGGKQDLAARSGQQDVASRDSKPASPDSGAAAPESGAAPSPLAAQDKNAGTMPAGSGQNAEAAKEFPASAASQASKQAAEYVKTEDSSGAPKVMTDEKAARSAKIGRQVPAAPAAKGADPQAKNAPQAMTAEKAEKPKHAIPQGESSGRGKGKGLEKLEKDADIAADEQPWPAGPQTKEALPGKPVKSKPGVQEKALSATSGQQTASVSESPRGQAERQAAAKGGKIVEISFQDNPGEFVLTLATDGPVERVTSFYAKDPARLAVDIWGGWHASGPSMIAVNGPFVERIRTGVHPDKLRLVIDYRDKELSGFSEPVVEKLDKGLVVRVPKNRAHP